MLQHWYPHPKQEAALKRSEFEVLYGGARGGGKTDCGIVWLVGEQLPNGKWIYEHPEYRALVIRRNSDDLSDWIDRARRMYALLKAEFAYKPPIIRLPSGAAIRTGHLKDEQAYTKYQGHEYQRILIEELNQIPDEKRYLQLIASCRSTVDGIAPQIFTTTNPGNVGHVWVKKRFVDPARPVTPFPDPISGRTRIYIPATIEDNPTIMAKDPGYVKMLDALQSTDSELYKAWRYGDWSVFAGQFFREFTYYKHTQDFFTPMPHWTRYAGSDWGWNPRPFTFIVGAMEKVSYNGGHFNRLWICDEIGGTQKTPAKWAKEIMDTHRPEQFEFMKLDPSANIGQKDDGALSVLDQFVAAGIPFTPANNDRVNGWIAIRKWLSIAPDGKPYMIIHRKCTNLIESITGVVYDENKKDDIDTDGPDDWVDGLRYLCIHLKWIDAETAAVPRDPQEKKGMWSETGRLNLAEWEDAVEEETEEVI